MRITVVNCWAKESNCSSCTNNGFYHYCGKKNISASYSTGILLWQGNIGRFWYEYTFLNIWGGWCPLKRYPSPPILICMLSLCFYCAFCPRVTPRELFHLSVWVLEQNTNTQGWKKALAAPGTWRSVLCLYHSVKVLKARWCLQAWWWLGWVLPHPHLHKLLQDCSRLLLAWPLS